MSVEVLDFGGGQLEIVEQDTCYVVCNDVGVQGARGESGYISSIIGLYRIQTTVGGEPTSGHIRYNNATQTSATILTVHDVTQDGIDVELFLALLATGTPLVIQDKDDYTNYQIWEISSTPTENPNYFSIPVTLVDSGGTGTTGFANNHQVFLAAFGGGGGGVTWGSITGTLSNQTDLQTALDGKVDENAAIVGATKTKITYDTKGLVTAGADATTADINDSLNRRYVTDAQLTVIGNTSGTNTGDQTITLTGDVTGSGTGSFAASLDSSAITGKSSVAAASGDSLLISDASDSGNLKKTLVSDIIALVPSQISGSDTQVQFNDGGAFGGDADFTYNKTTNTLTVPNLSQSGYTDLTETAAPSNPSANVARLYNLDIDGFSFLSVRDNTGLEWQLAQDNLVVVRNTTGSTIAAGKVVYVTGANGGRPTVALARSNSLTTLPAIGITVESISNNSNGRVMKLGVIDGLDTSGFTVGDPVYVSSSVAGDLTATAPSGANYAQKIGVVTTVNPANGRILVNVDSVVDAITSLTGDVTASGPNAAAATVKANLKTHPITLTIDGAGSAITTGSKAVWRCPYDCTISNWTVLADLSGSIVIDVKKSTYAGFPTTSSIAGSEKPTLSSAQKNEDTNLTTWTTSVTAGDVFEFVVDSASTVTKVTLTLGVVKT